VIRRPALTAGAAIAGAAFAAHMVPSVVSLGQWASLRALPGGLCRWRGPALPNVALTFDDGPHPDTTPLVLDRLDELGLVATFFCLGSLVAAHPELVGEISRRGHQIEAHGYAHDHHFIRTPRWVRADLDAELVVLGEAGVRPTWFRPPYGQTTGATMLEARRHRLDLVLWSAWGREWDAPDAGAVADLVIGGLGEGAIVLLHDTDVLNPAGSTQRVIEALGPITAHLESRGLAAVTLDQLVGRAA
jgi:peptidoglycan/xylan/chitin deacetylase (PgdA/CDA1 family)